MGSRRKMGICGRWKMIGIWRRYAIENAAVLAQADEEQVIGTICIVPTIT